MRCLNVLGVVITTATLLPSVARAQQEAASAEPNPARWESSGTVVVDGETIAYDAVLGSIILRDEDENPTGELFYTAYTRSGVDDVSQRPIMFAYNGGPGSASLWLHMGVMGPRRVSTPGLENAGPPPYPIEDNAFTLLDRTDLVMVDPIGTGFSRPLGDTEGSTFWGVDEDAASITQFIRRYLSETGRWNSPKFLLGESYGTIRSAVLAGTLQQADIDLNGIVLVSAVLDLSTLMFPPGNHIPYVVNFPSYAVTAWYLETVPDRPSDLQAFMAEVERFAMNDYATALLAGSTLDPEERSRVIEQMAAYTGLSPDFIDRADLRITAPEFEQELLREQGQVVGRLDARFTGPIGDPLGQMPFNDPQSSAISVACDAAINTYLRDDLGYDGRREYTPMGNVWPWNWSRGGQNGFGQSAPYVGTDLADAIKRNPKLEVLLVNGLYDLATPYFAAVWTMDQLGLPPELRDNIQRADFEAGHMMYVHEPSLPIWRDTLTSFIDRTTGGRAAVF
jgi:carboxypeptidase C (cathepsin A)